MRTRWSAWVMAGCMGVLLAAGGGRAEPAGDVLEAEAPLTLMGALTGGRPILDARLRFEHADQEGLKTSEAFTLRTRLGYATRPFYGVSGFLEFEDVSALNDSADFNQAGTNPGGAGRTVIADVEGTELNQAYLAISCSENRSHAKVGRQRMKWDNERFIGNVGWRQNEQTFDAALLSVVCPLDVAWTYAYVDNVNRIFGEANGTTPAGDRANAADWRSDSHLVHVAAPLPAGLKLTAYAYLLDFGRTSNVGATNASDTFGARLEGVLDCPLWEGHTLHYAGEYARQSDNRATAAGLDYAADYHAIRLEYRTACIDIALGREVLGSDSGVGFGTPLATLHAFNGWADVFSATPSDGLVDHHVKVTARLPAKIGVQVAFHDFSADRGSQDYGQEIDVMARRPFGDRLAVLAKYANYMASSGDANPRGADVEKFILETTFSF